MRIRETVYKNINDLPGYNLLGYIEVAIPIYEIRLHVLALTRTTIPVIEEFVLNFYNEGLDLDKIEKLLGLDKELIDQAWAGLMQRDYISYIDKHITEQGLEYLNNNSVEELEKIEFPILIDGITGTINKINTQLMNTRNVKKIGLKALKANIRRPNIDEIDFKSVKKVFNSYKNKNPDIYSGDILEIVHMEGKSTKFKRIEMLFFKNNENDTRILAYDGYNRLNDYEEKLKELDKKGVVLLKYDYGEYFNSKSVYKINELTVANKNVHKEIPLEKYNELLNEYMSDNGEIILINPLISICNLNYGFINNLEINLKNNKKITIIISGKDYISEYQKKVYDRLNKLRYKYKNFNIKQIHEYINKIIINSRKKQALVTIYKKESINLETSKIGIIEKVYEIKNDIFDETCKLISSLYNITNLLEFELPNSNTNWLKQQIDYVIKLVRDADGYMFNNDNVGWIGNDELLNITQFKEVPLATNRNQFGIFIENINKSLVESLDNNSKKKKHSKKYFWNDFKEQYPKLQHVLDKIRTYRNKSKHLNLTEENNEKYFKYLTEDLDGYMPDFIPNGYLILQYKIINELNKSIEDVIKKIKSN